MSEDTQDNKHSDDSSVNGEAAVMEQVAEDRATKKQGSRLSSLLMVAVLIGAGVAAWHYQTMWLPQAQQWWAVIMPTQQQDDPMAAPRPHATETELVSSESESSAYVLSAKTEETTKDVDAEATTISAAEEFPALAVPPSDDAVKDIANDMVLDDVSAINSSHATSAETIPAIPAPAIPLAPKVRDITITASIEQARQAFWARDLVKAEAMYREYLKREPVAADAWGELGNIYYGQAKWQQAAGAYAEAAIQLLEKGQYSQAMFLHYVVRGLSPAQVERIDAKLRAMQATPQS